MGLLSPRAQRLNLTDQVASRVQDNLADGIDAALQLLNVVFSGSTASPIATLSGLTLKGALTGTTASFSGALSAASAAISGNATVGGTLGVTGAITGAGYSGGPVSGTTVTGSTSVVSGAGFKTILGPFLYANTSYGGGAQSMYMPIVNTANAASTFKFQWQATHAGSVVGITVSNGNAVATTLDIVVQKNGATLVTATGIVASNQFFGRTTYTKGTNAFAAGDTITATIGYNAASINVVASMWLTLEMTA